MLSNPFRCIKNPFQSLKTTLQFQKAFLRSIKPPPITFSLLRSLWIPLQCDIAVGGLNSNDGLLLWFPPMTFLRLQFCNRLSQVFNPFIYVSDHFRRHDITDLSTVVRSSPLINGPYHVASPLSHRSSQLFKGLRPFLPRYAIVDVISAIAISQAIYIYKSPSPCPLPIAILRFDRCHWICPR